MALTQYCPCCAVPWAMLPGRLNEAVYVGGNENFPSTAAAVWKITAAGTRTRLYPSTPLSLAGDVPDIDADRAGNCYFIVRGASPTSSNDVYAVDKNGNLIWSHAISGIKNLECIAVTNDGYLYVSGADTSGKVYKLNAEDGTEQGGNWPYTTSCSLVRALCVDQSNNVYVGGAAASDTNNMVSLTASGTVRWTATVKGASESPTGKAVYGLAINLDNSELFVGKTASSSERSVFQYDPATGARLSENTTGGEATRHCCYDLNGNRFMGDNTYIRKNGSPWYTAPTAGPTTFVYDVGASYNGYIYAAKSKPSSAPKYDVVKLDTSGTEVWGVAFTGTTEVARCLVPNTGRIGCWGQ